MSLEQSQQPSFKEKANKLAIATILAASTFFIPKSAQAQIPIGNIDSLTARQLKIHPAVITNNNFNGLNRTCAWGNTDFPMSANASLNLTMGACNLPNGINSLTGQVSGQIKLGEVGIFPYLQIEQSLNGKSSDPIFGTAINFTIGQDANLTILGENQGNNNLLRVNLAIGSK